MKRTAGLILGIVIAICFSGCSTLDYTGEEVSSRPTETYFFQDIGNVGDWYYYTSTTNGKKEQTILSRDNGNYEYQEICRFPELVFIEYVENSFESSGNERMYFFVRRETGAGRVYSYDINANRIQIFLSEDCSNMIVPRDSGGYGWLIRDDKIVCVDVRLNRSVPERTVSTQELGVADVFPNGFFGAEGSEQNIKIAPAEGGVEIAVIQGEEGMEKSFSYYRYDYINSVFSPSAGF